MGERKWRGGREEGRDRENEREKEKRKERGRSKKFGHPARNEKNQLEKVMRNEPKIMKMLTGKTRNREIVAM